jgi:hypothetical protein
VESILKRVRSARRKLTLFGLLDGFLRGLFWAALAALVLVAVHRLLRPLPSAVWPALIAALVVVAAARAWRRRPSLRSAAMALDRAGRLEDRLAAALFVADDASPAAEALKRDAEEALVRAARIPLPLPAVPLKRLLLPALLIPAALLFPMPAGRRQDAGRDPIASLQTLLPEPVRKEESERLRRRAFSLEKQARELNRPELQEVAEAMRKTAEELRKEELTRNEALAKLSSLEEKSRARKDSIASKLPESLLKRMRGPSGEHSKDAEAKRAELSKKLSELSAAAARLKEQLGKGTISAEDKVRLEKELQNLSTALGQELGDSLPKDLQSRLDRLLGEGADSRDAEALARALGDLKESLGDLETLSALEAEMSELFDAKDGFADSEGSCLLCGKSMHGQKGGT